MKLCYYGCGHEGRYKLKNGRVCCSEYTPQCPSVKKRIRESFLKRYGVDNPKKSEIVQKKFKNTCLRKYGVDHPFKAKKFQEKYKNSMMKKYGVKTNLQLEETKAKIKNTCMKKYGVENPSQSEDVKKKKIETCLKNYGVENPSQTKEFKESARERMLDGGSAHAHKFIKNPSKEEIKLRKVLQKLYPESLHTYKLLNYTIDIALPRYKIAIEYDGYYHFDCKENIDYHNKRQKEIEELGWKFLRYNIFQKFPTKIKLKEDIDNLIK